MSIKVSSSLAEDLKCFIHHKDISKEDQLLMEKIRQQYIDTATMVLVHLQRSRSKSLALTHLEESCFRAIQAIALQNTPDVEFIKE